MSDSSEAGSGLLGKSIDVRTAIWIATTALAVIATFFATRTNLESRIGSLETYREQQGPIDEQLKRFPVFDQINTLTLVERELESLNDQILAFPRFEFEFGPFGNIPGVDPSIVPPGLQRMDVVVSTGRPSNQPVSTLLEAQQLINIAYTDSIRTLDDNNLVTEIFKVNFLLNKYNSSYIRSGIYYPYGNWTPPSISGGYSPSRQEIRLGAEKSRVDDWETMSNPVLIELRTLLGGPLIERIREKRLELEDLLLNHI